MEKISDYIKTIKPWYFLNDNNEIFSTFTNKVLKYEIDEHGYCRIGLSTVNKGRKHFMMHSIINRIRNGPPPKNMVEPVTDHINGIITDNRPENLRWLSRSDNNSYEYKHNGIGNISNKDLHIIFQLIKDGHTLKYVADRYNTTSGYIHGILTHKRRANDLRKMNIKYVYKNVNNFHKSDIKSEDVPIIFDLYKQGIPTLEISKRYNTSKDNIEYILRGRQRKNDIIKHNLVPYKSVRRVPDDIKKKIYDMIYNDECIINERIYYKLRWYNFTTNLDFKNKYNKFDPNKELNFEDFWSMNEYYECYDYDTECDIIGEETKIGETEYIF